MRQVVYMTLLYVACSVMLSAFAVSVRFSKIRNSSKFVKAKKIKQHKIEAVIIALFAVLGIVLAGYSSYDLIKQDFVTENFEYVGAEKGIAWARLNRYRFDNGDDILTLRSFPEDGKQYVFKKGMVYRITYAPRADVIVDVEGEERTAGLKTIFESGNIKDILIIIGLIGVYIAVNFFRIKLRGHKPERKTR
ncbi:MAG: hypothetical protein IK955_06065 [Clostridia bacterium]|nr:hypothetical protein [Clostridia bacterium]